MSTNEPKPWPTRCDAPDLSALKYNSLFQAINRTLGGGGPTDAVSNALSVNFVRIVDATLEDYRLMREWMDKYLKSHDMVGAYFFAISHAESCIVNLVRAVKFGRKIKNREPSADLGRPPVLHESATRSAFDVRNEIQHLDDSLTEGKWKPPDPHCLTIHDDCVAIMNETIPFEVLAKWITALHGIAEKMSHYKES